MSITIHDIAEQAGVSTATVSRVLNNSGFVKASTRRKITKIMKQHNYTPQESQRRRVAGQKKTPSLKNNNFAMIWAGGQEAAAGITAQRMMQGLSEAASQVGATINIEFLAEDGDISEILARKKIDGFFLNGHSFAPAFEEKIQQFPVIWLLQSGPHNYGDRVQPDHSAVGLISYQYLRAKGCKKLCCITNKYNEFYRYWRTREQAFCNAAEIDGVECSTILMEKGSFASIAAHFKSAKTRPDGIFVANEYGMPVYVELIGCGLVPHKDFEIVVGDKEVCIGYCKPEPVKIDIGALELGKMAMEAMIWRLQHPGMPRVTYMVDPALDISEN